MQYEIDQSGKIEQTNISTVVTVSNGLQYSVQISSKEKRDIKKALHSKKTASRYPYIVFSLLCAIVIAECNPQKGIVIDTEYVGHERQIELEIKEFVNIIAPGSPIPTIRFTSIGTSSHAHIICNAISRKKRHAERMTTKREIMYYLRLLAEKRQQKKIEYPSVWDRSSLNYGLATVRLATPQSDMRYGTARQKYRQLSFSYIPPKR